VPITVTDESLVVKSLGLAPVSREIWLTFVATAVGAAVSMVSMRPPDRALTLPATSTCLVVTVWSPSANRELVMLQLPEALAVPLPRTVAPSYKVTVAPASAVPLKVGVLSLVMLSVSAPPESEVASRSGVVGGAALLSKSKVILAVAMLPASSVSVTATV